MPILPQRRVPPVRPPAPSTASSPEPGVEDQEPSNEQVSDPGSDFLFTGSAAKARVAQSAEGFSGAREFFITTKELEAARAKTGTASVTVNIHFCKDVSKPEHYICVPRVGAKEGPNFRSYTAAGGGSDCAICAATGKQPSMCPVFVILDHRTFKRQDGSVGGNEVKLWIPRPAMAGIFTQAVKTLAENLGCTPDQVDVTQHVAQITKVGTGRSSTMTINFLVKRNPMSNADVNTFNKVFKDGYMETLRKWLAPNPRYMISKGGTYIAPATTNTAGRFGGDGGDEAPY